VMWGHAGLLRKKSQGRAAVHEFRSTQHLAQARDVSQSATVRRISESSWRRTRARAVLNAQVEEKFLLDFLFAM